MAWSSLAANQMVSYTDAQGGGFTLNSGQSSTTSNQCMTKSDALTKYYLDSTLMSGYSSNQLVPKSAWVGGPTFAWFLAEETVTAGMFTIKKNGTTVVSTTTGGSGGIVVANGDVIYAQLNVPPKEPGAIASITLDRNGTEVENNSSSDGFASITHTIASSGTYTLDALLYI